MLGADVMAYTAAADDAEEELLAPGRQKKLAVLFGHRCCCCRCATAATTAISSWWMQAVSATATQVHKQVLHTPTQPVLQPYLVTLASKGLPIRMFVRAAITVSRPMAANTPTMRMRITMIAAGAVSAAAAVIRGLLLDQREQIVASWSPVDLSSDCAATHTTWQVELPNRLCDCAEEGAFASTERIKVCFRVTPGQTGQSGPVARDNLICVLV